MKQLIFLCLTAITITLNIQAQIPASLTGNWINRETNDWEYGFFEQFAIHDCDFWDYADIKTKGQNTTISLTKDGKTLTLDIKQKNDSVLNIKTGKEKSREYILMRKRYPAYSTPDSTPFPEPTFTQDSATISGYYRNFDRIPEKYKPFLGTNMFKISVPGFIEDTETEYLTSIDSLGRFSVKFPIINTQETYTDWGRIAHNSVFSPGDHLFIFVDINDLLPLEVDGHLEVNPNKEILFMGENGRLNNELLQFQPRRSAFDWRYYVEQGDSDMELLEKMDAHYKKNVKHLDDYIARNPNVSEKFRTVRRAHDLYEFAFDLMQHSFDVSSRPDAKLDEGYMNYVNTNIPLYNKADYTFIRDFRLFLRDYTEYYQGTQNTNAQLEVLESFMKKKGSIKPEIQKLIDDVYQIEKSFEAETNSVQKAKMEESLKDKLRQIFGFTEVLDALNEWAKEEYYKSRIEKNDSIIAEPVLSEWLAASLIFGNFDYTRTPMSDTYQQIFDERISNPFLRDKLLKINDYYTEIQSGKVEHEESLKNLGNLSGDGEEIFRQLVEPYRGKVIYLDVWGTWCSPCREQMKHVREIEERLAGKDIIFMYLANNSPETTWRNFIKELNLTGKNIVHYRLTSANQQAVEAKLKVHSYPSYFIIDREGKIVNDSPSPVFIPATIP